MAERLFRGTVEQVRRVAHETRAPADDVRQDEILAEDALGRGRLDARGGDDRTAVQRPAAGQGAHQAGERRRGGVAVGRGDLDPPPFGRPAPRGRRPRGHEGGLHRGVDLAELGQGGRAHQLGAAGVLAVGQADPEIQAEGLGDVLAQRGPHGAAVDAAEDLAGDVAEGQGVVAAGRADREQRGHGRQLGAGGVPVEPDGRVGLVGEAREPRLVGQGLLDGDVLLAALRELGPDVGDGLVVGQASLVHQTRDQQGRHRLGGREQGRQGVGAEGDLALAVGEAAHQVDDDLAVDRQGKARAQFAVVGEVRLERLADAGEAVGAQAVDLAAHPRPAARCARWARSA